MNTNISTQTVKDVLKTLPIGYYIGRDVPVEEDNTSTSSYDLMNDIIRINTNDVVDTINRNSNVNSLEEDIRAVLYHELSHAMLTPKTICPSFEVNVVEDVRIQEINRGYFHGVDWDDFDRRYLAETKPDCAENAFIRFCKLGEVPANVPNTKAFIKLYDVLKSIVKTYTISKFNAVSQKISPYSYIYDCQDLFYKFKQLFDQNNQNNQGNDSNDEQNNDQSDNQQNSTNGNSSQDQNNKGQNTQSSSGSNNGNSNPEQGNEDSNDDNGGSGKDSNGKDTVDSTDDMIYLKPQDNSANGKRSNVRVVLKEGHREKIKALMDIYNDAQFTEALKTIINKYHKVSSLNSSAINAYSGVFDSRAAFMRDDYKYFVQKNRQGNNRAFSKTHFNLFLDSSGSFKNSEDTARMIIKSLCWLERQIPDFSFTLITCNVGEQIVDKKNIAYCACGGTELSYEIFNTFKKVQEKNAVNFNIVLYDGEATSFIRDKTDGSHSNFAAFNTQNTLIITDPDNEKAVMEYCPSAMKIVSTNYANELKTNLLKMLELLLK